MIHLNLGMQLQENAQSTFHWLFYTLKHLKSRNFEQMPRLLKAAFVP
jgi:hypothetical protein